MINKNKEHKVAIFDVSSHLHRIFHSISKKNEEMLLLQPFLDITKKEINSIGDITHTIFVFDGNSEDNFRHQIYPEYKAGRDKSPEVFVQQKREVFKFLKQAGACVLCIPKYEADDIIGTLSTKFSKHKIKNVICTKDKDLFCLVDEHTKIFLGHKKALYGVQEVFQDKGVYPYQMTDFLTMLGDKSDNIKGIDGCGEKSAALILKHYQLEEVLQNPELLKEVEGLRGANRIIDFIQNNEDDIWFMRSLVELENNIPLGFNFQDSRIIDLHKKFNEIYPQQNPQNQTRSAYVPKNR